MATLLEVAQIKQQDGFGDFTGKVKAAALLHAIFVQQNEDLTQASNKRVDWVQGTMRNPDQYLEEMVNAVVSDHSGKPPADIIGLSDSDIQVSIQTYVDEIYA
jgi:hypothetical protein